MLCVSMTEKDFEEFLHEQIPITKDMGFSVIEFSPSKVRIGAKLGPNSNRLGTAFGGSISSLMTICGWALAYSNMGDLDEDVQVFIQKSSIEYIKPIESDFVAETKLINKEKREKFYRTYRKLGKARLELQVLIKDKQEIVARFRGVYVVLNKKFNDEMNI